MKGFEHEEVGGLFTFYRQQAEYEQQKQQQKREKALKKKQKQIQAQQLRKQLQQAEQKQKQKQKESEQMLQKQKYISSSPSLEPRRQDYIEKAKRYIKELQQSRSNKLMLNHRKKMRRHSNFKQEQEVKFKEEDRVDKSRYGNDKMEGLFSLQQSQIFVNKKDFVKMNYMMLFDKEAVIPKQFNSIQIFDSNKPAQLDSRHYSLQLLRKQPSHNRQSVQKLPRIKQDSYSSIHPSLSLLKKDPKKSLNGMYNPMDIILNNEKFKIIDKEGRNNKNNKVFRKYQSYNIRNQTVQFVDAKLVAVNKIGVK